MKNQRHPLFLASCPGDIESLLENEIMDFPVDSIKSQPGGISFRCPSQVAIEILLNSRTASKLYKYEDGFAVKNIKDLYNQVYKKWWHRVFDLEQTFKIKTVFDAGAKEHFNNSLAVSQRFKDAVVDQFRDEVGSRPDVEIQNPDVEILLRLSKHPNTFFFQADIYLNMAGAPLSNRGLRKAGHQAPLRENLAAAIIMSTEWKPETECFMDSMCGTGTFLVEAALIKSKLPPSYLKIKSIYENKQPEYAFQNHKWFKEDPQIQSWFNSLIESKHKEITEKLEASAPLTIYGTDIDPKAIQMAMNTIVDAELDDRISIRKADSTTLLPPGDQTGVILCNPPYGQRMGSNEDLENLYYNYGENLKNNFKGFKAYIFTGEPELRKKISLRTSARIPFRNGNIECRLLKYDLF